MINKKYFEEFDIKFFIKLLLSLIILYFIRLYFYKGVDKFILSPFQINKIEQSIDLDILGILLTLIVLACSTYLICKKKLIPTINSISKVVLLTIFYLSIIRYSGAFTLESFSVAKGIKYIDVLFLLLLLMITKFRYYPKEVQHVPINGFIEDNFKIANDILGRSKYALDIGVKILDTQTLEKAFVIAINSPWGFGKSGFLLLLETFFRKKTANQFALILRSAFLYSDNQIKELFANHKNIIIVNYNPWKNFDDKKTVQNFFNEFSSSLNQFDSQISKSINSYANYLSKLDDSTFTKILEIATDSFQKDKSLTKLFDEINKSIDRIKKRIVVFVDDLDRLTGDELIDILRLIRNTANFRNTFFIVAYDHNYVLNTIDKKNLISSKEEYLQKIIQLEITLPTFNRDILIQFLNNEIKKSNISQLKLQEITLALNEITSINVIQSASDDSKKNKYSVEEFFLKFDNKDDSIIFKVFQNIRDVIRFINSFKLSFESIGEVVDVYELIMLELLKIKFLSIYQMVTNRNFLKISKGQFVFKSEEFDKLMSAQASQINIRANDLDTVKTILKMIFNPSRKIFFRSIKYPKYFDIYFTYRVPSLIKLEKIENALESGIDKVVEVVNEAVANGSLDDLRSFVDSQTDFGSKEDFEIILKTLFYLAKYDNI